MKSLLEEIQDRNMSNHQGGTNITTRKKRRGMIEKRRRDKINNSLCELRRLVPAAFEKQGSAKLEKAEILQMTVDYLRSLHAQGSADNLKREPSQQHQQLGAPPTQSTPSITGYEESNNPSNISSQQHADAKMSHHQNLNNLHLHHHQQHQQAQEQQQQQQQHQQQQQQQQQQQDQQHLQYNQNLCSTTPTISSPTLHAAAHHHLYSQHHMSVAAAAAAEHASAAAAADHATAAAAYRHLSGANPLMTSPTDMAGMISHHHAANAPIPHHLNHHHHHHHQSPLAGMEHSHTSLLNLDHHHHHHQAYHNQLSAHYNSTKTY